MREGKKLYYKAVDGTAEGVVYGDAEGIHDYNLGERLGPEGEPGIPEDKNEPVDLLHEAAKEYNARFKGKYETNKQADIRCLDAMCRICDAMMVVAAALEDKVFRPTPDEMEKLAGRMAKLGTAMAEIRGRIGWRV